MQQKRKEKTTIDMSLLATRTRERERGSERLALTVYPNFKLKFALTRSSPLPGLYDAWMPAEDEPPNEWE